MKPEPRLSLLLFFVLCIQVRVARAEVRLPGVFTDHMVLQRDMKLPIWGWAKPGETIAVSFANQHATAMADGAGRWQLVLNPLPASAVPELLTVEGSNKVLVADVLVGDVWLCSGQSNMQLQMQGTSNAQADIPAANRPLIRLLQVDHIARNVEQDDISGHWTVCSPKTIAGFSAAGYYFGRDLQDAINVPIGLIHSSWGGTIAEAWSAPESLRGNPILAPILIRYKEALPVLETKMKEYRQAYAAWAPKAYPQDPGTPGWLTVGRRRITMTRRGLSQTFQ